jgi:uncharacterized phiE125 gp8 family phage protein
VAAYQIVTPPAVEPVTVFQAKAWLRIDFDDDDDLLYGLIVAARDLCETFTQRAFITQTWKMVMDAFPGYLDHRSGPSQSIRTIASGAWFWLGTMWGFALPFNPVQAVVSVDYNDQNGTPQTLVQGTDYNVDLVSTPARIMPVFSRFWPISQFAPNAVTVTFKCGYGDDPEDVPQGITTAILMLVSYWYGNRDAFTGATVNELPMAVKALLWQYRDQRF